MIITDDFGVEFDIDCLEVNEDGHTIMVFSKEEIEHILSIDSDDDPDDILARDVGVCNSRHKLNDFKR